MIQEVAVLAAVPADLEAGDQAEAAGVVETDQGPAQAVAEDPDPGFLENLNSRRAMEQRA